MRGWINYYGRFYRVELIRPLRRIDDYLVRWAMRKYKRLRAAPAEHGSSGRVRDSEPDLFAHWHAGAQPTAG